MILGFVAAALAVLTFHQGMIFALGKLGLVNAQVWNLAPVGPLKVPQIVNQCFWGGLYGAAFGVLWPYLPRPVWLCGLAVGIFASLVSMFVVAPLKGGTVAAGWQAWPMARNLLINGFWGLGLGLIAMLLLPRRR
jgi:hypothetical protein